MANRRTSWRRAPATQPHHRRPQKNQTALPFSGVENHALLTLLTHLLAKKVNVSAANGAVYTGLFAGTQHSPNSNDLLLTLRFARLVRGKPVPSATVHDLRGTTAARIHIPFSRVTTVIGAPIETKQRGFATDSQISRGSSGIGRQLQRFEDFSNVQTKTPKTNVDQQTFGSLANDSREKWDQFQVNQAKFGVTTSFDETEYTTTIDRSSKDFAQRQREADRLAEEIESAPSQNVHVREERNQDVGTDFDEEARYSGVQRPHSATQQPTRSPPPKDSVPEKPRLSYAAAAASAPSVDHRPQLLAKAPSSGSTHGAASMNKSATQAKNALPVPKQSSAANAKQSQQSGKASQDQPARNTQSTTRGSYAASNKSATPNGRVASQTPRAVNKKGPGATSKPQQHQGKNAGTNAKTPNQATSSKSASQSANLRPSTQTVNPKSSASAVHAKTSTASTRTTTPSQVATTSHEQSQAKSSTSKTAAPTPEAHKDKPAEEKPKPVVKEKASRDSLPQIVKVRSALAGRASPNQTRNSPLPTPAVAETSTVDVLNLDAQTPNLGPEHIKSFEAYKRNREFQSMAANREKITDDLKKFSTQLDSKNGSLRRSQNSGSSAPGTPRASVRTSKNIPESTTAEKAAEVTTRKDVTADKEDFHKSSQRGGQNERCNDTTEAAEEETPKNTQKETGKEIQKEKPVTEAKKMAVKAADTESADQTDESATKTRPKSKSKLNPNAQEFKLNPDAPSFTPASQKAQPQSPAPYAMYSQPLNHMEYPQQVQLPPGYAVPIQAMAPMPYAPQSYVVVPTVPTPVAGGTGSGYPFVQQTPSFGPAHVGGRFPQSAGIPVSYGYHPPQVTPMVIAQAQQRVPTSPYYHNSAPYAGGQPAPGHMTAPHQAHLYQGGAPHIQGGLAMPGRGGHGNPRRGGANRSRGKTSVHSYPHVQSTGNGDTSAPKTPEGARSPGNTQR